jgi:hypothetical protein
MKIVFFVFSSGDCDQLKLVSPRKVFNFWAKTGDMVKYKIMLSSKTAERSAFWSFFMMLLFND